MAGLLQATFATNSMEGATSCVNISILQDLALEGDHEFSVEVTSATPSVVTVGMPSEETVTILDDESRCTEGHILSFCIHGDCGKYIIEKVSSPFSTNVLMQVLL